MVILKSFMLFILFNTYLFSYEGIGKGTNREESIILALNNVSSQIMTTVNSSLTIKKRATTDNYSREVEQILKSDIVQVTFNGYQIIEEKLLKNYYFIKLKVNKEALVNFYINRLNRNLISIKEKLNSTSSSFKQYNIVKESNLNHLYLQYEIISTINRNYNLKNYGKKLAIFQKILNKSFSLNVKSNNEKAKKVAISILTQNGFTQSINGNIVFKITLSPFYEQKYSNGECSLKSDVIISIIENKKIILSKNFLLVGGDLNRFYAERAFFNELKNRIKEEIKDIL